MLYSIATRFYYLLIRLVAPFNPKAKLWVEGRRDLLNSIKKTLKADEKRIWIHCSSLGEFEQGRPVIERLRKDFPDHKIVLTFFSPSGYEIRKNYEGADSIFYLPQDTRSNAKAFISLVNPSFAIFVKYEFWMYYLKELNTRKIPLYLVSAIFRKEQLFFRWYGGFYRKMLYLVSYFFVQNEESKELLLTIGLKNVMVSGDTRFDRVYENAIVGEVLPLMNLFSEGSRIFIAGSTYKKDTEIITAWIPKIIDSDIKIIIAPHEIKETEIESLEDSLPAKTLRYSRANAENIKEAKLLIIDSIGTLSKLYKYGDIAYIGGGFGKGIHNILEAAAFGMPIIIGPNYERFMEAQALVKLGTAQSIHTGEEFVSLVSSLIHDKKMLENLSKKSKDYVEQNKGATEKILTQIIALAREER